MKKRIVSFLAIFTLALSGSFFADAAVLNEVVEERELIGGVTYKHIQRLEDYGWQDVYAVQADLRAPGVKLEVLKSQNGESFLENTYQMAVNSGALAAVNADFFAAKRGQSGRGSAVGVEVRDGKLTSSASVTENMNTFYKVFGDDRFYVNAFVFNMSVTAANGKTDKIKVVNKYDDLTGIVMYTDDWGEYSVGSKGGSIEVAVDENGKLIDGDRMIAIFALDMKNKGILNDDTAVVTVMTNLGFKRFAEANEINVAETKVGDRYVLEEMLKHDYKIGGEQSGHIIFKNYATTGDGQLSGAMLASIMSATGKSASETASVMTVLPQTLVNIKASPELKAKLTDDKDITAAIEEVKRTLGKRGRILVRASGTEPLIRVMLEGEDIVEIKRLAKQVAKVIEGKA